MRKVLTIITLVVLCTAGIVGLAGCKAEVSAVPPSQSSSTPTNEANVPGVHGSITAPPQSDTQNNY